MNNIVEVGERVSVAAVFKTSGGVSSLCYPAKMHWRGQEIVMTELALRHPTSQGRRMVHVFDMYDGAASYRLEFDAEALTWTLAYVMEGR